MKKFSKLTDGLFDIGFECMIVIGVERNRNGRIMLSVKHKDKKAEHGYEQDVIKLLKIVGVKPKDIKASVEGLQSLQITSQINRFFDSNDNSINNIKKLIDAIVVDEEE